MVQYEKRLAPHGHRGNETGDSYEYRGEGPCIFSEVLPLTLEEIFISETEVAGYDIKEIIHDAVKDDLKKLAFCDVIPRFLPDLSGSHPG